MMTCTIIGAGKLGRTLGRMFHTRGGAQIGQVWNRTLASARLAVEFIGQGTAIAEGQELIRAEVFLISTPDDAIAACVKALARSGAIAPGAVVFHASGALPAELLAPARQAGAAVASVHPAASFADPATMAKGLDGIFCGAEGDPEALVRLRPMFEACGGRWLELRPENKVLYHAGAVFACNYLAALLETALECYERAGVPRATASELMAPLVLDTAARCLQQGPAAALTGPIARGDAALVGDQAAALAAQSPHLAALYQTLGQATVDLARQQNRLPASILDEVAKALKPLTPTQLGP